MKKLILEENFKHWTYVEATKNPSPKSYLRGYNIKARCLSKRTLKKKTLIVEAMMSSLKPRLGMFIKREFAPLFK